MGMAKEPYLIIMDEPTNHMDLPSIQCLEDALGECPCALLLVSHDMQFLSALTQRRWEVVPLPAREDGAASAPAGPERVVEFELRETGWD
jgi:ATPase subunit of ABC transporter with duplicated ATPase domains